MVGRWDCRESAGCDNRESIVTDYRRNSSAIPAQTVRSAQSVHSQKPLRTVPGPQKVEKLQDLKRPHLKVTRFAPNLLRGCNSKV